MDTAAKPNSWQRRLRLWLVVVALGFGAVYARAMLESRAALLEGHAAVDTDSSRAITSYRHAVEWYAPLNPYAKEAADALFALGVSADDGTPAGQQQALEAFESLRMAVLVTRSVYTPQLSLVESAEARIATLRGAQAAARNGTSPEAERARQLELLRFSRARAPNPAWSLVTTTSFVLWIVMTIIAIRGSRSSASRSARRHLLVYGGGSVAALAMWLLGLTNV